MQESPYNAFFPWKVLLHSDKCRSIVAGQMPAPVILHIYPTNRCNQSCRWCIMAEERANKAELSQEVFEKVLNDASKLGVGCVHVSGGGEPTLYPFLHSVQSFGGYKVLSTNGTYCTRSIASRFDRVRVSLNAATQKTYEDVCRGDWVKTLNALIELATRPRSYSLGVGFVADEVNYREIIRMADLANQLGLDFVQIRPACRPRNSADDRAIRAIMPEINEMVALAEKDSSLPVYFTASNFDGYWGTVKFSECRATPLHVVVTADAKLAVCQDVFIKWGDLTEQTLTDAWFSKEHEMAIRQIDLSKCPRCVMTRANEAIEHIFMSDEIIADLL